MYWGQVKKLVAPVRAIDDTFGFDVAIDGSYALIGMPGLDKGRRNAGAVYFFKRDSESGSWDLSREVQERVPTLRSNFGYAVAINAEYAAIKYNSGFYIFCHNSPITQDWKIVAEKGAKSPAPGDGFGFYLTISGSTLVEAGGYHSMNSRNSYSRLSLYALQLPVIRISLKIPQLISLTPRLRVQLRNFNF